SRPEPDAGQTVAGGRPRRRAAVCEGFRLLQGDLQLDHPGCPLWRSSAVKDSVVELMRAEPAEILMTRPGETTSLKIVVRYQDDQTRDVTHRSEERRVGKGC